MLSSVVEVEIQGLFIVLKYEMQEVLCVFWGFVVIECERGARSIYKNWYSM